MFLLRVGVWQKLSRPKLYPSKPAVILDSIAAHFSTVATAYGSASASSPPHDLVSELFEPVIGLEVHASIASKQKLFSSTPFITSAASAAPNTLVSVFDAAFPGSLPVLNKECLDFAIRAAIALKSPHIAPVCRFDRKHYFYPDLPNGYQITQYFDPIARGGKVYLMRDALHGGETSDRHHHHHQNLDAVDIQQIQIEQDSGKTISGVTTGGVTSGLVSLVDLNRAGVGVLEIVTEPCITSSAQAVSFLKTIYRILWHHGITNPNIEDGSWRVDVNVSVRRKGSTLLGNRTEIKHIMTFSGVGDAIEYEFQRQAAALLLSSNSTISASSSSPLASLPLLPQETRGFDEKSRSTFKLRDKEDSMDYRFMPEPDLPPVPVTRKMIERIRKDMKEDLDVRQRRLLEAYGLSDYTTNVLMDEPGAVEYFEQVATGRPDKRNVANWVVGDIFKEMKIAFLRMPQWPVSPSRLGSLLDMIQSDSISAVRAKNVLRKMISDDRGPLEIATEMGFIQVNDSNVLESICSRVIHENPKEVIKIKNGNMGPFKHLMGQVMREMKGKANPKLTNDLLRSKLGL